MKERERIEKKTEKDRTSSSNETSTYTCSSCHKRFKPDNLFKFINSGLCPECEAIRKTRSKIVSVEIDKGENIPGNNTALSVNYDLKKLLKEEVERQKKSASEGGNK